MCCLVVLSEDVSTNDEDHLIDKRLIVDEFIKKKLQPTCEDTKNWNYDMITYFKYQWEAMKRNEKEDSDEDEVYENNDHAAQSFIADEILDNGCGKGRESADPTSCRIVVGWNADEVDIMVVQSCNQSIFCLVEVIHSKVKLFVSFIYASNSSLERRQLWNDLLLHKNIVNNKAWVLMGDFNVTLKPEEHSNGASSMSNDMNEFKDAVNKIEVDDLCSSGFQFTWTKSLKNPLCNTLKKLDRIMTNDSFVQLFQEANGVFLPYLVSDHNPAIMSIPRGCTKKKKSFRFANYVADKEEFLRLVKEEWKHEVRGCQMYKVVQRLKMLKKPLNNLNWHNGNLFERASKLKGKLKEAQSNVDADPFDITKRQIAMNLVNECTKVAEDELKLLHQKAKVQWLKEGDKNSAYFQNILKARKNKSRIVSICCEDGSRVEGEFVSAQFVKHFQNFLGTTYFVSPLSSMGDIVKLNLPEEEALDMIRDVSDKEIKEALFDIDSSKAAGPNGYTSCFFKKAWGIIGSDICLAIREFFISGKILGEINATLIALVPKIDTPYKVSDFRPIACSNVLYKCISKILTNRIKEGLSKVVSLNQSAFIHGRHIQDNILITQELLKGYNRSNGAKRCAMKIDIHKAYDTINWEFLKEVLLMVGFHETMVHWIMTCITSASFSICINGEIKGFFEGGRGLRQGDPISPYLFTLVMEVFNMIMIKNIGENGKFKYHYGCKDLKLTHMCFADDLLVLCNGDTESLKVVKKSLDDFISVSGLFPNLSKSTIFFGSISDSLKEDMLNILPFKCGKLPMKIQLIAFVLSTMQQYCYWASVYMLPKTVTNELEKIFKRFLWNPGGSVKGKAKVAWKNVCRPKDQGGLGFKPMHKWNEVLLISQLWKLIDKKESLWVKWVSTVKLKGKSIWEADINNNDSHGWKELMRIRDIIKPYVKFRIGDGKTVSVWHDAWCDLGPLDIFIQNRNIYDIRMSNEDCLADAIVDGKWKWSNVWSDRFPEICQIEVPLLSQEKDRAAWIYDNRIVEFSTHKAWITLREVWPKVAWYHVVWFSQCRPKQAIILWLAVQKKLLTQNRMVWVQDGSLICSLCKTCADSHDHLFFDCPFSKEVWKKVKNQGRNLRGCSSLDDAVTLIAAGKHKNNIWQVVNKFILSSAVYNIWMERNKRWFQMLVCTEEEVIRKIIEDVSDMLKCIRVKKSPAVLCMAQQWNLKWDKERLFSTTFD
uniref:Reverse transcriptase domain-containing protein n=1 Tax=Tanacetum cinerariifolium TaxID=118510 RepID=A0A6L2N5K1_TANCI|nr:hypothetical protein [Tanacetum cinerariifolium]